jgi:imidazolonepropionase
MDIVITNIGQLITPVERALGSDEQPHTLQITTDATLCIQNGRIVDALPARVAKQAQTVDAGGGVVMPGLIDPFWVMPRLPAWIDDLPESRLPGKDLLSWSLRLLQRTLRAGVTTVEVKCPHDSEFTALTALGHLSQHHHPRVVGTLLASLPEDSSERDRSMSSLIGEVIPEIRRRRLATFCDIGWGAHDGFITEARAVLRAASGAGLRPKLHIQVPSFIEDVRDFALSLEVAAIGCASHLSPTTAKCLSEGHVAPVYLPAVTGGQTGKYLNTRALLDQGVALAIGSGNGLLDSPLKPMWSVLASAIDLMGMSLPEAIVACTLHNAMALEMSHEVGSLEPGKLADLILLDLIDYRELETAVVSPPVSMVMVNGEIVQ